uniref:Uncharacterized protein n=1 Tax=Laticauda laticaudata TaxID=8630 RepID=A0A8C5RMY0_LATLA
DRKLIRKACRQGGAGETRVQAMNKEPPSPDPRARREKARTQTEPAIMEESALLPFTRHTWGLRCKEMLVGGAFVGNNH